MDPRSHRIAGLRWRIKARLERAVFERAAPLAPGEVSLMGKVELAAGAERAIRCEVTQTVENHSSKHRHYHLWTEVERKLEVHPFYLRLASGTRVRVEPPANLHYAAELSSTRRLETTRRIRHGRLEAGEQVFVHGELRRGLDPEAGGRGYRDSGEGLVLGAPRRGRMLVSSQPPALRFRRRARARLWAALVGLVIALVSAASTSSFIARSCGRNEQARVSRLTRPIGHKGGYIYNVFAVVSTQQRAEVHDQLDRASWDRLREGSIVPVRFVPSWTSASAIGWGATLSAWTLVLAIPLFALALVTYIALAFFAREWHEGRRLVDRGKDWITQLAGGRR